MKKTSLIAVLVIGLAGAGIAGLAVTGNLPISPAAASSANIPTAVVTKGEFVRTVSSTGELKAARSVIVVSPFDGKVTKIIPEGTPVKSGDPVIWLDTEDLRNRLKEEEPKLELAKKDLEAARDDFRLQQIQNEYNLQTELAKVQLAEQREQDAQQKRDAEKVLFEKKVTPKTRLDEADLALLSAGVELRSSRINMKKTEENLASSLRIKQTAIDKAQLEVDRATRDIKESNDRIEQSIIRAPANGEVSYIRIWKNGALGKIAEGDSVWPRLSLAEIPDRAVMLASVPINELDVAAIQKGQTGTVVLDALPGRVFKGTVDRKSIVPIDSQQSGRRGPATGSANTGPREFEVQVQLEESDPAFFQGMTATVKIEVSRLEDALAVPIEAVTVEDDRLGVYRNAGLRGEFVPVKVLMVNDRFAAVEGQIAAGTSVYLRHPLLSQDDARIAATTALEQVRKILDAANADGPKSPPMQPAKEVSLAQ